MIFPQQSIATLLPSQDAGLLSMAQQQGMGMLLSHAIGGLLCLDIALRKNRHPLLWAGVGVFVGPLAAVILLLLPPLQSGPSQAPPRI